MCARNECLKLTEKQFEPKAAIVDKRQNEKKKKQKKPKRVKTATTTTTCEQALIRCYCLVLWRLQNICSQRLLRIQCGCGEPAMALRMDWQLRWNVTYSGFG